MTPASGRLRVGGNFRIQGQGYKPEPFADGAGASGSAMSAHALPADTEYTDSEDEASNPMLVDELVGINKTLEKQIETLRLRLDFDRVHHESQKQAILSETESKLRLRTDEINKLKDQLADKEMTIKDLDAKNKTRDGEINALKRQIDSLNKEVNSSKEYAEQLAKELANLTRDSGVEITGNESKDIASLKKEISDLKSNLAALESELAKAREVIVSQGGKIKLMDSDKKTLQLKFKEELAKVSQSMRLEVEKMRDVMVKQWEEMRFLREQNVSMSRDIKDIRSLLLTGSMDDDSKVEQIHENQGNPAVSQGIAVHQTARGGKNVYNGYNFGAMKPSLPVLNKDKKSHTRRK